MNPDWLISFDALHKVLQDGAYSNIALNESLAARPNCNQAFVRALVKGTLTDLMRVDYLIDHLAKNGLNSIKARPLTILRMGIYAISEMDSVPDHVAVNEAVKLANRVSRGTSGFINGLLRSYARDKQGFQEIAEPDERIRMSIEYSFPISIIDMFIEQYGVTEAVCIMNALNGYPPLVVRTNTTKCSREELIDKLGDIGCTAQPDGFTERGVIVSGGKLIDSAVYRDGFCTVQSSSSIKAIEVFAPRAGSRVLDMCAAPGGKSTAMAEMMENRGSIVACDIHDHRLQLIDKNAKRLGLDIIEAQQRSGSEHFSEFDDSFDFVLADVPCSGLGVIAGKPELKYRYDGNQVLTSVQKSIIANAYRYTKPDGYLMYSTCTIDRRENQEVVDSLSEHGYSPEIVEKDLILPYNNKTGFFYTLMKKPT